MTDKKLEQAFKELDDVCKRIMNNNWSVKNAEIKKNLADSKKMLQDLLAEQQPK